MRTKALITLKMRTFENIFGKGENAVYQHFLLFPQCFQTAFYPGSLKVELKKRTLENIFGKGENAVYQHFLLFPHCFQKAFYYTPVEDGTYYGITHGRRVGGRAASTFLSGAYLQNYSSYGYEISWVDRSHQGGVQCTGIVTLASLIFQLLPFFFFHT